MSSCTWCRAIRSAGLKNSTAKHLVLASQSLSAVIALISYIRKTFRLHFSPKKAVMLVEFDKLGATTRSTRTRFTPS